MLSLPQTMVSIVKGLSLTLYLTLISKSVGALLAQEVSGQSPYIFFEQVPSRSIDEQILHRPPLPHAYLYQTELRHYFLAHSLNYHSINPSKYFLSRPAMTRSIA